MTALRVHLVTAAHGRTVALTPRRHKFRVDEWHDALDEWYVIKSTRRSPQRHGRTVEGRRSKPRGPVAAERVRFVTVEAQPTAVVAQTTTWTEFPNLWGKLLGEVYEFVRRHPELATRDGDEVWQNVMLYKDQTPDVEVGVLVSGPFRSDSRVILSALPAGDVATATHRGDYAMLGVTHEAVREYAAAHGRELAGPCWEIYGHAQPDPGEAETDVFWLLR
jgi:effector-binding domain-containing protein